MPIARVPGVVYPTLTFLEEAGYVTAESEGAKKRYTITDEGRAYLEENRDIADMVLARLAAIGEKLSRMRRKWSAESDEQETVPRLVNAALDNLREVAAKRLEVSEEAEAKIVEILARAAQEIRARQVIGTYRSPSYRRRPVSDFRRSVSGRARLRRIDIHGEAHVALGLRHLA